MLRAAAIPRADNTKAAPDASGAAFSFRTREPFIHLAANDRLGASYFASAFTLSVISGTAANRSATRP